MKEHLVIDGNAVYEIDMECMEQLERKREKENSKRIKIDGVQSNDHFFEKDMP